MSSVASLAPVASPRAVRIAAAHLIDGALVASHGTEVVDVHDPHDGVLIGRDTMGDAADVVRAAGQG
ncbi:hypothetical protein TBR22_A18740 [Luteitalea sp. TBR-22]|uniref:hypothetical protein n=1 Tax=Luteitalea sp. TBR-22 TaxID=2802971 RepID=UPI001AF36EB5|nr:hypothetical protein [Luteitalea sp. TBR-22]BCS32660.1 hypothetical protein TBR22_A18740 [Luteitalea sp. TBR-22]